MSTLDERLEEIRERLRNDWRVRAPEPLPPLPKRSEALSARVEYVLNKEVVERMKLAERGARLPKDWSWAVIQHVTAAVKPAEFSLCKRWELRIKARIRRIGEWLFKITS